MTVLVLLDVLLLSGMNLKLYYSKVTGGSTPILYGTMPYFVCDEILDGVYPSAA